MNKLLKVIESVKKKMGSPVLKTNSYKSITGMCQIYLTMAQH